MPGFPGRLEARLVDAIAKRVSALPDAWRRGDSGNLQRTGPGRGSERAVGGKAETGRGGSPCVHFMTLSQQQRGDKATISRREKKKGRVIAWNDFRQCTRYYLLVKILAGEKRAL